MNIYSQIKEQISAKDVVRDILGEPQKISGESYVWTSPFREGDNDPSFSADDIHISDFGDEDFIGKDIFNFVSKYYDYSNEEALKYIVNKYNIQLDLSQIENKPIQQNKQNQPKKIIKHYYLTASQNVPDAIFAKFDTVSYTSKPTGVEIGKIKNRIPNIEPMVYTLDNVKTNIINGHTCIPAGIKSEKDWQDNTEHKWVQIFMVDIDNVITVDGKKQNLTVNDENHVTVEKIIEYCNGINLLPTFVYYTFSHTEEQHKFRLVYILDKGIQESEKVKGIYQFLKEKFKDYNIDTAPTSIATLFLGGQSLAHEGNIFYKIEFTEEEVVTDVEVIEDYALKVPKLALKNSNYAVFGKKLWLVKKENYIPISNFIMFVDKKQNYINGRDTETFYKLNCILLDDRSINLPPILVTTDQYAKHNFILGSAWDKYCIISAGNSNDSRLREVTQLISRYTMKEKNIYSHTGFNRIDGKLVYFLHNKVIGDVDNIDVDLSTDELTQYCSTTKTFDVKEALTTTFSLLEVASHEITIPALSLVFLSPLTSLLKEKNIFADFIMLFLGKSGTRKSSFASLLLCFFGNFTRNNFPCSFRDTINTIEKKSFIIKDALNVVDDYNPLVYGSQLLYTMERLYALYGDRTGRGRMSKDGKTLNKPYIARGQCLVTAETIPTVAQSRIARSIVVNFREDSIDLNKLSVHQNNYEQLSFCMEQYIKWIIKNEKIIMKQIEEMFNLYRQNQDNTIHGRTNEICNVLTIGFNMFLQFLLDNKVIEEGQKVGLEEEANYILKSLLEQQSQDLEELKPTDMFYQAIEQLLTTNEIKLKDYNDPYSEKEISDSGKFVGYFDTKTNYCYFFPDIIYGVVEKFYQNSNKKFPINEKTLWKYLFEEGFLYRTDPKRYKIQKKKRRKKPNSSCSKT